MSEGRRGSRESVVLIAPSGEPGKRVRLAKVIRIMKDNYGHEVAYWGWRRLPDETLGAGMHGVAESRALLAGAGHRNALARLYYLAWMIRVFVALVVRAPRRVYCLGLETALPAWAASRLRSRISYVFDDADRLVMLWSLPALVEKLIGFLERRVSAVSVAHIVPTLERYDYRTNKLHEIGNTPEREQVEEARRLAGARRDDRLQVYVNGWLNNSRGLALIDGAAERLDREGEQKVVFNVAVGRVTGPEKGFLSRGNVNHLGSLTHTQSLAEYLANDVVLTFYDPAVRVNRYALPNKWGDAVAMGTPIILNEGIRTARVLVASGAAFVVPFDDPVALATLLRTLHSDPDRLASARAAIAGMADAYVPFDEAIRPVMASFFSGD